MRVRPASHITDIELAGKLSAIPRKSANSTEPFGAVLFGSTEREGLVDEDHDALIRLARLNAAEARKMAQMAREAARRSHEACDAARQKLANDIAYIERLKASHARTGIIRG
jgi:hypothetical protein